MGFYEKPEQRVMIKAMRVAADVPESERTPIEIMRTDTVTFRQLIEARRNRREEWFQVPAGRIEIGNMAVPVRLPNQTGGVSRYSGKAGSNVDPRDR